MGNIIKDKSKKIILDAALELFVKNGYSQTSMDDIVNVSGLSKGAIYHHYSSKKTLFLSLIDYWETFYFKDILNKDIDDYNADEFLREISKNVVSAFKNKKYIFLAELEFWSLANYDNEVRSRIKILYVKLLRLFKSIINKGIDDGIYKKLNVDVASLSIMTALQGVIWFSIFEDSKLSAEQYLNDVIEFIIYGFKKVIGVIMSVNIKDVKDFNIELLIENINYQEFIWKRWSFLSLHRWIKEKSFLKKCLLMIRKMFAHASYDYAINKIETFKRKIKKN